MALPRAHVALERALSKRGLASRREARELITAGRVSVNGHIVTHPLHPVVPERDTLVVDGRPAAARGATRLVAFHKPRGIVTTRHDPEGRRTVFDALGDEGAGLVAVGRLDLASSGLLLLTNDTQLANWLTDPTIAHTRRYVVTVRGSVSDEEARRLERGIECRTREGAEYLRATAVTIHKRSRRETHLIVELSEGRNREIRRLFNAIDHEVTRLLRVSFAGIELGDLPPGRWTDVAVPTEFRGRAVESTARRRASVDRRRPRRARSGGSG
jgi:23S rRNA pseudouridine2605 synthase